MRLWHQHLLHVLPSVKDYKGCSNQLGGQHTEVRMILGSIKRKGLVNHSTVNYINNYSLSHLRAYGLLVIDEMLSRGFNMSQSIIDEYTADEEAVDLYNNAKDSGRLIYLEHDNIYMKECVDNLKGKGIILAS
jgi:uncharacterized protein (TIGR02328 family)